MNLTTFKMNCPSDSFYDTKDQLRSHINKRTMDAINAGHIRKDRIKSIAGVEKRKDFIRKRMIKALGGLPRANTPLNAVIKGQRTVDSIRIESIVFESRPKNYVTCLMYIPAGLSMPSPSILFLCGHHREAKNAGEYVSACMAYARAGFPVLAMDPFGQGERLGYINPETGRTTVEWGVTEHSYAGCQCLAAGDSIARYFVHDSMRAIDYMMTREEIDGSMITVTGNSGGGTQTCLMMMCDPRIAAAVPATFVMSRESYLFTGGAQDSEQIWSGTTAAGMEHDDILIAMTPKPVLILSVKHDFFPVDGTAETVRKAKRFWDIYGKGDLLEFFVDDAQHNYTENHIRRAVAFLKRNLRGTNHIITDFAYKSDALDLICTESGQVGIDYRDAKWVFDENLKRIKSLEMKKFRMTWENLIRISREKYREMVFRDRKPCDTYPKKYGNRRIDVNTSAESYMWWSQTGVSGNGILIRRDDQASVPAGITIATWTGGTEAISSHGEVISRILDEGRSVLVLDLSGEGGLKTNLLYNDYKDMTKDFYGALYKFTHDLIFIGDSLAALRIYEVTRAVDFILDEGLSARDDIDIYSEGRYAIYALTAAFADDRIRTSTENDGDLFKSGASWAAEREYDRKDIASFILPGMQRIADLPEIREYLRLKRLEK